MKKISEEDFEKRIAYEVSVSKLEIPGNNEESGDSSESEF